MPTFIPRYCPGALTQAKGQQEQEILYQTMKRMIEGARDKAWILGYTTSFRDVALSNLRFEGEWARAYFWLPE